jgi:NhaP-type Na+/H+ and K+/H+ antiporter
MSGRNRLFGALALAALAGIVALAVVLVGGGSKAPKKAARASSVPAVRAQAVVAPTSYLFGDTVNARVLVLLDRRRVEPKLAAAGVIASIPVLLLALLMQRYIVREIAAGSVK